MSKEEIIEHLQVCYGVLFADVKHNYKAHTIEFKGKLYEMNKRLIQASKIGNKFITSDDLKIIYISLTDFKEMFLNTK